MKGRRRACTVSNGCRRRKEQARRLTRREKNSVELGGHDGGDEGQVGGSKRSLSELRVSSVRRLGERLEDLLDDGEDETVEDVEEGVL